MWGTSADRRRRRRWPFSTLLNILLWLIFDSWHVAAAAEAVEKSSAANEKKKKNEITKPNSLRSKQISEQHSRTHILDNEK